jgi:hypothetical protein
MIKALFLLFILAFSTLPQETEYYCPMHSEERSTVLGKCPKCGMALVPTVAQTEGQYQLKLTSEPKMVASGKNVNLRFTIFHPKTAEQVKEFTLMHEQFLHLFIVSQDMNHFQHIHPILNKDGSFSIDTSFPVAGHYKLFADFYPSGGTPQVIQKSLTTSGYRGGLYRSRASLVPDQSLVKTADGIRVELKPDSTPAAGRPFELKYLLTDVKTGRPVDDLQPYLGAWGHTLILSEDLSDYVHSHPSEAIGKRELGGPEITFDALLPRPGNYRIWTQFQRGNILTTVHFTIKANKI